MNIAILTAILQYWGEQNIRFDCKSANSLGFITLEARSWRFSVPEVWVAFRFRVATLEYVDSLLNHNNVK